jgi:hypothetical protein
MENKHWPIWGFVFLLVSISGCHREFSKVSRGSHTTQKQYALQEPLRIKDYSLYNAKASLSFEVNSTPAPINGDSLMQVFWKSFEKLDLPTELRLSEGKNQVDSAFYDDYVIKIRKIDEQWVKDIADADASTPILVPIIHILTRNSFTSFISSGGLAGSNGFNVVSFVNLIVYVVEDGEIVYSRHVRHSSDITKANSREEAEAIPPAPLVTQEHWDELVRRAMKDYIKRLK